MQLACSTTPSLVALSDRRRFCLLRVTRQRSYGIAKPATYVKRYATIIRSNLSRHEGGVEKQPELSREIEKLTKIV